MDLRKVNSSHIDMVGYDTTLSSMMVRFKNGDIYEYSGVDESTYNDLLSSPSIGKYFAQYIKNRFNFKKIGNEREMSHI